MVFKLLIDGKLCESSTGEKESAFSPFDCEKIAEYPLAREIDCENAIAAAQKAYDEGTWCGLHVSQRILILKRLLEKIKADSDIISEIEAKDTGMMFHTAKMIVEQSIKSFEYYIKCAENHLFKFNIASNYPEEDNQSAVQYEPYGICGIILPWNLPFQIMIHKLVPCLLAGNSAVVKPSPLAPCSVLYVAQLITESGFPSGAVNVVTGDSDVGRVMSESPAVNMISFTGSSKTGRTICRCAAETLKKTVLECGGNSTHIIFDTADSKMTVNSIMNAIFPHAGQFCVAGRRLLIQEKIYKDIVKILHIKTKFSEFVDSIKANPKFFPIEPVISESSLNIIDYEVHRAQEQGAEILIGGKVRHNDKGGAYYYPTILTGVTTQMDIFKKEVFGPVIAVMSFDEEDEAVRLTNRSDYGLSSMIWTEDLEKALRVAYKIQTGSVYIGTTPVESHNDNAPFSGFKLSGLGVEHGLEGFKEFSRIKHIMIHPKPEEKL